MTDSWEPTDDARVDDLSSSRLAAPAQGMSKVAVEGAAWLTASRVLSRGTSLIVRTVVLAQLLGPGEFGRFGACLLVLACVELLTETGFQKALVQTPADIDPFLNTAWTVQVMRGLLLGVLVYVGAPYLSRFFNNADNIVPPLRVLALTPVLTGFTSIGIISFQKELQFKKLFVIQTGEAIMDLVVSVAFALWSPTVWALVLGRFASQGFRVAASYCLAARHARLGFSWSRFRQLHSFGVWVFLSSIAVFLLTRGSDFVIGRLMVLEMLGVYQVAYALATMPTLELARVITNVTFPVFSLLQGQAARLQLAFLRSFLVLGIVVMFIVSLTIVLAHDLVMALLDDRWQQAAVLIAPLAIWGGSRAMGAGNSGLFLAVGRPALATLFQVLMLVFWAAAIYPATSRYGLLGASVCLAVIGVLIQILRSPLLAKVLDVPALEIYVRLFIPFTASISAVVAAWLVQHATQHWSVWFRLPTSALVTVVSYVVVLLLWDQLTRYRAIATIMDLIPGRIRSKILWSGAN